MKTHILTLLAASLVAASLSTAEGAKVTFATLESVVVTNVDAAETETAVTYYDTSSGGAVEGVNTGESVVDGIEYFTVEDATTDHLAQNLSIWDSASDGERPVQIPTDITFSLDLDLLVQGLNDGYISGNIALLNLSFEYTNTVSTATGTGESNVGLYLNKSGDNYQLSFLTLDKYGEYTVWEHSNSSYAYESVTLLTLNSDGKYEISSSISDYLDGGSVQLNYTVEHTSPETSDGSGAGTTVTLSIGDETSSTTVATLSSDRYGSRFNTALSSVTLATAYYYAVPEPATATLSLLALAGLAARRRRK